MPEKPPYLRVADLLRQRIANMSRERRGGSPFRADMASLGQHGTWESHPEAKVAVLADIVVPAALCQIVYEVPVNS